MAGDDVKVFEQKIKLNGKRLVAQFDATVDGLLYELIEIGEQLNVSTGYAVTERIGKWQWREALAREYGGEICLTEEDHQLLNESFKFQAMGKKPDLDKADFDSLKKWATAEINYRWLCFCFHARNKIIRGDVDEYEGTLLFSMMHRAIGWIEMKQWESANAKHSRKAIAKSGAEARNRKKGYAQKRYEIQALWASGKYSSRDICAEQECAALGMSFSAARKALRNTPEPA